eukprot:TRINITY_DN45_c0_g1_i1.p1 TRINITY_DN45_c0_g1~~TRINITY_DN45_c0_g1_i1.p1  ORF type:complete len:331 (-),score=38.61 TRINITY_DN45_c0_g1_i1:31-1023(-)
MADWEGAWDATSADRAAIKQDISQIPRVPLRIFRSSQLDALHFDSDISNIVHTEFMQAFQFLPVSLLQALNFAQTRWIGTFQAELEAIFRATMYGFSILSDRPSFAMQVFNLTYRDERKFATDELGRISTANARPTLAQRILLGVLTIGAPWAWQRLNSHLLSKGWADEEPESWHRRIWVFMQRAETAWLVFSVLNFFAFLVSGKYRSLAERLLRMRLVYARTSMARQPNFEFLNRQLVWSGFTEFLLFLMPLMNVDKFSALIRGWLRPGAVASRSPTACVVCASDPARTPCKAACGHVFCYYCVAARTTQDSGYSCPSCGRAVQSYQRL